MNQNDRSEILINGMKGVIELLLAYFTEMKFGNTISTDLTLHRMLIIMLLTYLQIDNTR